jgi:hypothetical protein
VSPTARDGRRQPGRLTGLGLMSRGHTKGAGRPPPRGYGVTSRRRQPAGRHCVTSSARCVVRPALKRALELGLGESLLERLMARPAYARDPAQFPAVGDRGYDARVLTKLVRNYRSHPALLELPNAIFYDGDLMACADPAVSQGLARWQHLPPGAAGFPLLFHAVEGANEREGNSGTRARAETHPIFPTSRPPYIGPSSPSREATTGPGAAAAATAAAAAAAAAHDVSWAGRTLTGAAWCRVIDSPQRRQDLGSCFGLECLESFLVSHLLESSSEMPQVSLPLHASFLAAQARRAKFCGRKR